MPDTQANCTGISGEKGSGTTTAATTSNSRNGISVITTHTHTSPLHQACKDSSRPCGCVQVAGHQAREVTRYVGALDGPGSAESTRKGLEWVRQRILGALQKSQSECKILKLKMKQIRHENRLLKEELRGERAGKAAKLCSGCL